ncbi:Cof-type HAD-IIB family hydrolase [Chryseobacterium sp. RLHN22]|uniref:Cof-type HAD-IIB family hydrolase n=1 Tax=Chryseobacterium sp. RLHN22 TaxID=3437885 RepID=UPI003D9BE8B7
MKNIKLIVTDMDGTFLNSKYEVSPDFPEVYEELKKRNILFVPASGRQMSGITQYFGDIENEIGFIAENGGYVVYKNEEVFADKLSQKSIADIIQAVREIPGARAVLSAKGSSYYESDDQDFVDYFSKYYIKNEKKEDLAVEVDDSVFKIAIYHPVSSEEFLYPALKRFENEDLVVVVSGKNWVDIMNKNTNKGNAIEKLQKSLNILPEQTMAFGDYLNDIEMLKNAHYSYAMKNAHPSVKEAAKFEACSNDSFGVLETIKTYLNGD